MNKICIAVSFYPSFNRSEEHLWSALNKRKTKYAKIACRAYNLMKQITVFDPKLLIRVN